MLYGTYIFKHESLSAAERIKAIKAAGFDFIALSYGADLAEQVALCHQLELPIENVHLNCRGTSKLWDSEEEGAPILEGYCRQIRECAELGIKIGIAHVTYGSVLKPAGEEGLARFGKIVECAKQYDFTLAFENSKASEHLSYVLDHFKDENVRFCYDTGHDLGMAVDTEYFNNYLPRYGDRLGAIHLHDTIPGFDMHSAPFDGAIDWQTIAGQLAQTDYAKEKLCLEPGGRIHALKEGRTAEELRDCYREMAIAKTSLMQFYDGYYTAYAELSFEQLLERYLAGMKRVAALING